MTQRIPSIQPDHAPPKTKELFAGVKAKIGMVPNIYKVIAQSPLGLEGFLQFSGTLAGGSLDAATRERIALAVANVNGCDYCNAAHTTVANILKLSAEEIEATAGATRPMPMPMSRSPLPARWR
jgi:AhpD family alkylhydroperoxidase